MSQSTKPIEAAAADFGRHSKGGGGWALGLTVAACVQPDNGHGGDRKSDQRNDRYVDPATGKVSATRFAELSGTSAPRVLRHLKAWDKAAAKGLVAPADSLTPADWSDADHLPEGYEWATFYDASAAGGRPRDSKPEDAVTIIERRGVEAVVAEMTDEQVAEVVEVAAKTRPKPTREGLSNSVAGKHEAPFTTPPVDPVDVEWMEAETRLTALHTHIHAAARHIAEHPEPWRVESRVAALASLINQINLLPDLVQGISDSAIDALLDGAS